MSAPDWLVARPIAHRGLHDLAAGRAENTLAAAEAAIQGGYAIECDIQVSADGEAMVFHDHDLDRLTAASGPVRARRTAELAALSIGGTDELIPTLAAFLDTIAGRTPVVVEVKSRFDGDETLARRFAAVVAGRTAPIAVKSFDPAIVSLLRRIAPSLPRGIVAQSSYGPNDFAGLGDARRKSMSDLLHWNDTRPDFLSWRHTDLPAAAPFLARTLAAVPVMTWTVRSQADAGRALAGADQIVFEGFAPA